MKGALVTEDLAALRGLDRSQIPTPALVLDRAAVVGNIAAMATWAEGHVGLRPHTKTHKCVEIARLQLEHGAIGLTTATVAEATAMLAAGPGEILIANEVVTASKIQAMTEIARHCDLIVAVDDNSNASDLAAAATAAGVTFGVVVDLDLGMHRCGVRSIAAAVDLAKAVSELSGLRLRGVTGFEGHTVLIADRGEREAAARNAVDMLGECAEALRARGLEIEIVSAGGTNTHDMTGLHPSVTELQVGTYATMDHGYTRFTDRFRPALAVAATVVSRSDDTAVLDCGTKTIALDVEPPSLAPGLGHIREVHEEHTLVDPEPGELSRGTHVEIRVGYAGGTINLHDAFAVVDGGIVTGVWAICARGSGIGL
jgi:D-serine deaminase-like pyridoxal phosphate-dependent protein